MAKRFQYTAPDASKAESRQRKLKQGAYDSYIASDFKTWKPKAGENRIRIIQDPAAVEAEGHDGITLHCHNNIGPDNNSYLCLAAHKGEKDPIEAERRRATRKGDLQYARDLAARQRVLFWVIDRADEKAGPQLWSAAKGCDIDLFNAAKDEGGGIVPYSHPEEGYDVIFHREGEGKTTKYSGIKLARRATPLSDSPKTMAKWLQYVVDHPLASTLVFYDYDHIEGVFSGGADATNEVEDEDEPVKTRSGSKSKPKPADDDDEEDEDDEDEVPVKSKGKPKPADDDDEDEEDDAPVQRKSKGKPKPADDEEDDDEDEDDEPPVKRKGKPKPADDDDDDEDDDDDDEPPVKRKGKPADDDEEEEDEEDDDDEDDDDDEPPVKRKGKPKPADDDDDDEDDDDDDD